MKKGLTIFAVSALGLLVVGCGNDKKEETTITSNLPESNVTSNITSNDISNVNSNDVSNINSNDVSNVTSNVTSNQTTSGKKLSCSADYSSKAGLPAGNKVLMGIDVNFNNNDKIDDMSVTVTYELSDTYKPQIDTLISTMNSTYKNQLKGDHFKINTTKISDKAFKTSIFMDYKNMTEAEKKTANVYGSNASESYSINKRELEQQGFTCK